VLTACFVFLVIWRLSKARALVPSRGQGLVELLVEAIDGLAHSVIGHGWRAHTPLILTLFFYIWIMNLSVLVPGMKSATANINITVGLAVVVFLYVQITAIRVQGIGHYLYHLAGEPKDAFGWVLSLLMFPLHVIGEFIKPMSLSLRLCFNIFAEDVLLAVIVGLGIGLAFMIHLPVGIPFQILIIPLLLIFSTVQALVFSLLAAVYISLVNVSEEHH
jgi:F-type H+-transporting ATPase subunit a